ncbi:MAG: EAL domain-containing protein [Pseudomonadota bacterium]
MSGLEDDCAHYEILVRMLDEQGGLIMPMAFIPAAERYGLMPQIDRWVVREAFKLHVRDSHRDVWSINLSGASLNDDEFLGFLKMQFAESGVAPESVCFEITETAAVSNLTKAGHFIRELRALGCSFSLDDFGSGMSSFGYLKYLPVDYLKIDGSFVKDMVSDAIDCAMVEAVNKIGHLMGLQTIAEFVGNEETRLMLADIGVNHAQGFGIGKPEPF